MSVHFAFFCTALLLVSSSALAEAPNLQPGLWEYTHHTTSEGVLKLAPMNETKQECFSQAQFNKGVNMLNIPQSCQLKTLKVSAIRTDFTANCDIAGMATAYVGHANFNVTKLDGEMIGQTQTPFGPIIMKAVFNAKRLGACQRN
jgi:hypothetical protein